MAGKPLKKPTGPKAPKKPTSKSKTGNAQCSEAASNWQLALRGKASLNPQTHATLGKCRALAAAKKGAGLREASGKYSEQGRAALEGRLQKRFDSDLVTQKSRAERLDMLLKQRKAKGNPVVEKPAMTESPVTPSPFANPANMHRSDFVNAQFATLLTMKQTPELKAYREMQKASSEKLFGHNAKKVLPEYEKKAVDSIDAIYGKGAGNLVLKDHKEHVKAALAAGKELPKSVLADYPDLAKPAPAATVAAAPVKAKYSLGGALAPGRGTSDRQEVADKLKMVRRTAKTSMQVAEHLRPTRYVDKYGGGSGIMIPEPFDANQARREVYLRMNLTRDYEQARRKARTLTRKANKLKAR